MNAELLITAHHEAGHAVQRALLGMPFRYVTVEPERTDAPGGVVGYVAVDPGPVDPWKLGLVTAAGPEAERVYLARVGHPNAAARDDWWRDDSLLSEYDDPADYGDGEELRRALPDPSTRAAVVATAAALMVANWPKVAAVAAALADRGTLTYGEVRDLAGVTW